MATSHTTTGSHLENLKALPAENSHRPLTSSMLEMPRSLMSTSGWFFSRLSSTNFFRDLDMICTKRQQQSTWVTAGRVQGQKGVNLRWHSPVLFSPALEGGRQRAGSGRTEEEGAGRGAGMVGHPSGRAETRKPKGNATHTHRGGRHVSGWAWKRRAPAGRTTAGKENRTRPEVNAHPNEEHALSRSSAQAHSGPRAAPHPARARPFPN